jgi:DNA-binding winged helix-turn-helix (wHTH) protein
MESSFRVGDWLIEPMQNHLVRGVTKVRLDPKVMQVLLFLAERPNEVAVKEKILESLWEGNFVTDEVLTNAIWELRKAFGDDAKEPKFIQTVPRKGYRLIAPVQSGSLAKASRRH